MSWEKVKLQKIIHKPISGEWGNEGNSIKIIRTTNFTNNGRLNLHEVVTRDIALTKVNKKKLVKGDTIIEKSGGSPTQPVGRVVYFNEDDLYLCNNFTSVIRPKENVNGKYLFWFLFNNHISKKTLKYQNKTTGIINLKLENYINEVEIPLPPLPIQEKIAAILDKADALRRKDQELLKKYDELAQAIFIDMFGNYLYEGNTTLIECVDINPKKTEIDKNNEQDVSFIPMASVGEKGKFDVSLTKKISEVYSGFTYFREGDVLFAKITPCMENGKGAIAEGLKNGIGFGSTEFHVLRPMGTLNSHFIYYFLSLDKVRKWAELNMTGSAGQKRVPTSFFSKLRIDCPPLHLQEAFTKKIELINQLKAQTNAEKSEELFQSLLQRAFKGELVR